MSSIVLNNNYIDPSSSFSPLVSSEQALFPSSNLFQKYRRSRAWRSNGFFEVVSGQNQFVFRDTSGVDLTATVAVGTYSTRALFFAAVKTAMQAVGASTYTLSIDSVTNRTQINSSLTGGGGIFQIRATVAGAAAICGLLGFSTSSDRTGAATYTADSAVIHSYEYLRFDLGFSTKVKAFVLSSQRNSPLKLSQAATITLEGNSTDIWTAPEFSQSVPFEDSVAAIVNVSGVYANPLRYWRVKIIDQNNTYGYVELNSIYLGDAFSPAQGSVQFPFQDAIKDDSNIVKTENGMRFADIKQKHRELDLTWKFLSKADKDSFDAHFVKFGIVKPFWISLDPSGVFSSSVLSGLVFVNFDSEPKYSLESPSNWGGSWQLVEVL